MPEKFLPKFYIKIGGADVPPDFMDNVIEIVVDSSLYLPEMFTILLDDPTLKWVDSSLLELGKEVEISAQAEASTTGAQGQLIVGEISALEPEFSAMGQTSMLVRGYNKSHRLHRGKKTRTFLKQTDSDVVRKIAGEVGLTPMLDTTSIRYDYILQHNQTNMEFLQARAERIGFKVYAAAGKLYFKKGDAVLGSGPTLKFGEELIKFQPQLAATHQTDKMKVLGWDAKQKRPITAEVGPNGALNQGGVGKTGGAAAQSAFGAAEMVVVDQPIFTSDEAKALAQGVADDQGGEFIQAEGVCFGQPGVKAGYTVTIQGVGTRFSGKYFVTSATHIYNQDGYETHFSISGRQPNTISHLLTPRNGAAAGRGLLQGVAIGLVTNLNDPDNLGRVKVKYPWLGDNIESDWIKIAAPGAGADRGLYYLPEINDEVLLVFEHGDVHRPYLIGGLWNGTDKPPKPNSSATGGGKVNERIIKSRTGHIITLDDSDGGEKITICDKTGKNKMVIDSTTKSMTINVDGDFTVDAKGKITLNSMQNMTLESKANGTVKGIQLTLEGTAKSALKAPMVSVEGQALAELKAGIVKIN